METVFENTCICDVEILTELNHMFNGKRHILGWCLIASAVVITKNILAVMPVFRLWWLLADLLIAGQGIYLVIYDRFWARRVAHKTRKKYNGEIPPAKIIVTDKFNHQYFSTTTAFPVSCVKKAIFMKHSICVFSDMDAYMTFQRTGFTKGSPEELEAFIREKSPQAEIIHKK